LSDRVRLVLLSFLLLFVELALIRWTGSNLVYLSYFSNFVLLGSFLGIGVGFLRARSRVNLFPWAPVALALLVVFVLRFPVEIDRPEGGILYFGEIETSGLPVWVLLPVVFAAVAATMAMLAEGVARTFVLFEPLRAYRLDVLGSIAGITAFSLLAFLEQPPLVWGGVAAVLFAVLLGRSLRIVQVAALLLLVGALLGETRPSWESPRELSWSPYYKIHVEPQNEFFAVDVNGIPHQSMSSLDRLRDVEPFYFVPYEQKRGALDDVLIVGAGTGTDVAVALQAGVGRVDAVEIDPRLQELGALLHPNRPYSDPRVDVHIQDGRAFLERNDRRYDLILFALPDSLTLVSGQSSLRLESYLFTREAMQEAREHLKPGGVFTMYNYYREPWLVDRLARTLEEAYGHPPCVARPGSGERLASFEGHMALLTIAVDDGSLACTPAATAASAPSPATDDYPFLYLRDRHIPGFYLLTIALILAASIAAVRLTGGPLRAMGGYLDLFFMGAAFLLLETKNVVQFALLFGTTWFVNALVFGGILITVLAAIEVADRLRTVRPIVLYGTLFVALAVAWAVPQRLLLELPWSLRLAAAVALAFAPIFVANLIFAQRFKDVGSSTVAFGTNLLGAMVGGLLEYSALVVGYRALLPLVAILYALALLSGRLHLAQASRRAEATVTAPG
jgi:spermidine synthase